MKLTGIVLAGGKSSRIGRDKALLEYGGMRLVERSISVLRPFCGRILISSNNRDLAGLGHEIVGDEHRDIGPIAGLHAALRYSQSEHHIVIPCDTPFVTVDVYERLLEAAARAASDSVEPDRIPTVVAGTEDGFIEPLIGYYHRSALRTLTEQIGRRDYKLHNSLICMGAKVEIFKDSRLFRNINTKADLTAAPAVIPAEPVVLRQGLCL